MAENIYDYYLEVGRKRFGEKDLDSVMDKIKEYYLFCISEKLRKNRAEDKVAQAMDCKELLKTLKAKSGEEIITEYGVANEVYNLISEAKNFDNSLTNLDGRLHFIESQNVNPQVKEKHRIQTQQKFEKAYEIKEALKKAMVVWPQLDDKTKLEVKTYQIVDHFESQTALTFGDKMTESPYNQFLLANFFHCHEDVEKYVESQEMNIEDENITM